MNIREQFGKYLLLKRLSEDGLGETFRAGRVGAHGMEQVILLRVFNGPGLDTAALTAALARRREVHKALVSPNVGNGVDLGEVRGVPFVAYDYISGKNLATLQDQATKRNHPIPSDHALLIAERIALALAVGYETRLDEERVLHGCVLPQLVMISNEGETRLLGFEAAPGLRQVVRGSAAARGLQRYLAPEARAGAPAHRSDDVYSLGAILLELLTGQPVPADGDHSAVIDGAELQSEGAPLPEELKRLLKQSLAPQDRRIGDVITWHKQLSRMMFEGQYNPTTFNLAFFMHNLFRDEIEKESREIEVEKTMEITVPPAIAAAAAAARPAPAHAAAPPPAAVAAPAFSSVREPTGVRTETAVRRQQKSGRVKLILGAVAALLVVGAGVGWIFLAGSRSAPKPAATQAAARPAAMPAAAAPDPAVLQQQAAAQQAEAQRLELLYQEMLEKQSKELEARFDQQLDALRKEAEVAKQRAAEAQAAAAAPPPAPRPRVDEPAPAPTQARAAQSAPQPAATVAAASTPPPAVAVPSAPEPAPAATVEAPAAPAVRPGDLVTAGPGTVTPRLQVKPRPSYPVIAQRLHKEATVVVRVLVDETGRVATTELKGREVGFGFDHEALRAARGAKFTPAMKDGVPVKMWVDLPIEFKM